MKKLLQQHEFVVTIVFFLVVILIGAINPAFFSIGNIFSLLKSMIIRGILALGVLIVIISGNVDISFTAISAFAMYTTSKIMLALFPEGGLLLAFAIGGLIGLLLGSINASFVAGMKLPALIVSLGTSSAIRGFMLAFIGVKIINNLPASLIAYSRSYIAKFTDASGKIVTLPSAIIMLIAVTIIVWFILRYTMLGRGVYALGGDPVSTERAGFNIKAIQYFIYCFMGFLSGIAGVLHSVFMRNANPFDIVGTELIVIASVVLGGASITGGKGTVYGTLLGVAFTVLIENSLIIIGVPSYWQKVVIGLIIVVSTAASALREKFAKLEIS
ncbi:MAG: ABC transporter permease [Spirochaetota bacterium]|jgi:simple sugar transport system permease protein|uniref:Putative ABC transporter permease protein n=2 Tax=Spirochaetales TaxID=136 RepID=A0A3P3XIH6_9SPIR|nr:ABC transporter permease [Rectinema subterraneum]SLM12814.1 putative ABC transporter permease protein [uncultured spirochete]